MTKILALFTLLFCTGMFRGDEPVSDIVGGVNVQTFLDSKVGKKLQVDLTESLEKPFEKLESQLGFRPDSVVSITFRTTEYTAKLPKTGITFELKPGVTTKFKNGQVEKFAFKPGTNNGTPEVLVFYFEKFKHRVQKEAIVAFFENGNSKEEDFSAFRSKIFTSHPQTLAKLNDSKSIGYIHFGSDSLSLLRSEHFLAEIEQGKSIMKAKEVTFHIKLNHNNLILEARGAYESNEAAEEAKIALEQFISLLRMTINVYKYEIDKHANTQEISKLLNHVQEFRKSAKVTVEDTTLMLHLKQEITDDILNTFTLAIRQTIEITTKIESQNNHRK